MKCNLYSNIFAGPPLPYKLWDSAMVTSPDGGGVILFGGSRGWIADKFVREYTIHELGYDADEWIELPQKLKQPRSRHVVIPFTN